MALEKGENYNHINEEDIKGKYQRAQSLLAGMLTNKIARNATLYPHWIETSDCFWYERELEDGKQYRLVDAKAATNEIAFDHHALGEALAKASGETVDVNNLPIKQLVFTLSPLTVTFSAFVKLWVFDEKTLACQAVETATAIGSEQWVMSPDGKQAAFARDYNLWVRDLESGDERPLTSDGEEYFVYAAVGSAWGYETDRGLQARWSPDSKRLFTVQRDTRQVKTIPIVQHVPKDGSVRPTVSHNRVAFPGDEHVETYRLLAIDVESGDPCEANYRHIPATRNCGGFFNDQLGWWAKDCRRAYFVDVPRDYKSVRVVEFDTDTGSTRIVFEETTDTHINLMLNQDEHPSFVPLTASDELLWFSERSGFAHLYLYDLETGALKNTVTEGEWLVRDVLHVDVERREVFVQTAGRVADRNPYYRDLCRVQIDTGALTPLTDSDHEYMVVFNGCMHSSLASAFGFAAKTATGVSPGGNFAVVTRSRVDEVPVSQLLDRDGKDILTLETADVSALPNGWQWPEPVKLLAADGLTELYGVVYRPSDFSPERNYPVVSHVFNNPELPWVPQGSFSNQPGFGYAYYDAAALAELGFVVVQIDGRGTNFRRKNFYTESYGWIPSAGNLQDHIAGLKQLAERYPYMDLGQTGITCHFTGGGGAVQGLLEHPEFYKVGVNGFLHDSRSMSATAWGDKYQGVSGPSSGHHFPEALAENLQGKLLLMHGMLDISCLPANTLRLVEALCKANKDFDLLMLPNQGHAIGGYHIRRAWDFLVRHLLEIEPPKGFKVEHQFDLLFPQY